jgi:hypothetical protein
MQKKNSTRTRTRVVDLRRKQQASRAQHHQVWSEARAGGARAKHGKRSAKG